MKAAKWFWGLLAHAGSLLLLLGLFGLSTTGVVLLKLPIWAVAVLVAAILFGGLGKGAYELWQEATEGQYRSDLPKVPVVKQTFRNERIVIDGKSFSACVFTNVRLIYRGRAGFDFISCTYKGVSIDVDGDRSLSGVLHLMSMLDFLHPRLAAYHHDEIDGGGIGPERPPLPGEEPRKGKPIRLVDLLPRNDAVQRNRHFKGLTLLGPALLLVLGNKTQFSDITFAEVPNADIDAVLWEIPEGRDWIVGAAVFVDCVFEDCTFMGVGVAGPKAQLDNFRRGLTDGAW